MQKTTRSVAAEQAMSAFGNPPNQDGLTWNDAARRAPGLTSRLNMMGERCDWAWSWSFVKSKNFPPDAIPHRA